MAATTVVCNNPLKATLPREEFDIANGGVYEAGKVVDGVYVPGKATKQPVRTGKVEVDLKNPMPDALPPALDATLKEKICMAEVTTGTGAQAKTERKFIKEYTIS